MSAPTVEGEAFSAQWQDAWREGARSAFLLRFDGARELGGYLSGFHRWGLDRRNGWFAGYNQGRLDRIRAKAERLRG